MRPIAILSLIPLLLALAACGADGEPEAPARTGLSVTGSVGIGIAGGS